MNQPLVRRLVAEAIGSAFLLATVIGSSLMGQALAGGSAALALFVTSTSTGAMLVVLIWLFAPVSGGHLNPVVSLAFAASGALRWREVLPYTAAQFVGFIAGVCIAHAMFGLPALQWAEEARTGPGIWLAEGVATFGLILVVIGCSARTPAVVPAAVGLFIAAAYWFTASTGFANPAMTVARAFTATPAGILPAHVPGFLLAQMAGAGLAIAAGRYFWPPATSAVEMAARPQRIPA